jgi:stress-induced morphogen
MCSFILVDYSIYVNHGCNVKISFCAHLDLSYLHAVSHQFCGAHMQVQIVTWVRASDKAFHPGR